MMGRFLCSNSSQIPARVAALIVTCCGSVTVSAVTYVFFGGADGNRTHDPLLAKQVL